MLMEARAEFKDGGEFAKTREEPDHETKKGDAGAGRSGRSHHASPAREIVRQIRLSIFGAGRTRNEFGRRGVVIEVHDDEVTDRGGE